MFVYKRFLNICRVESTRVGSRAFVMYAGRPICIYLICIFAYKRRALYHLSTNVTPYSSFAWRNGATNRQTCQTQADRERTCAANLALILSSWQ